MESVPIVLSVKATGTLKLLSQGASQTKGAQAIKCSVSRAEFQKCFSGRDLWASFPNIVILNEVNGRPSKSFKGLYCQEHRHLRLKETEYRTKGLQAFKIMQASWKKMDGAEGRAKGLRP